MSNRFIMRLCMAVGRDGQSKVVQDRQLDQTIWRTRK